jgi:hypothetical protein
LRCTGPHRRRATATHSIEANIAMSQHHSEPAVDVAVKARVLSGDVEAIAEATATRLAKIVNKAPGTFALVDARQLARDPGRIA